MHRADPTRSLASIGRAIRPRAVSRNGVEGILARFNETGDPVPQRGRPRPTTQALSEEKVLEIEVYVRDHPFARLATIREELHIEASNSTIARRLAGKGIRVYRPARKPRMTQHHRDERIAFAVAYAELDWKLVTFSDETTFSTAREEDGFVRRARGERYQQEHIRETRQSGRVTVGVWASIRHDGCAEIQRITRRLTAKDYINRILKAHVSPWFRDHPNEIFAHDNAPAHTAVHVRNYLQMTKKINVLSWPPVSPDLSPIENFWVIFKREVGVVDPGQGSIAEKENRYWDQIKAAWDRLKTGEKAATTSATIRRYYDGMPERLIQVRNTGGAPLRH